jgi:hypothetical protein
MSRYTPVTIKAEMKPEYGQVFDQVMGVFGRVRGPFGSVAAFFLGCEGSTRGYRLTIGQRLRTAWRRTLPGP